MNIKQFYDKPLAHASYALVSEGKMAVIDPGRDPQPYYDFVKDQQAEIVAVIETHPHADFVSSHLEIHKKTGATIYVSEKVGADYPHQGFDEGEELKIGNAVLKPMNTPGHSPDSITVVAEDRETGEKAAFTGDTLFVGDVGRPDLREKAGNMKAKREELALNMYESIHEKLLNLSDDTLVYPAHGAGSLCGKNMGSETFSNMAKERENNWALQGMSKENFVKSLLEDQPFIPKYFGYDVDINKSGAPNFKESVDGVKHLESWKEVPQNSVVIDARDEKEFKKGHISGAINIMLTENGKFETWLGAIVSPEEKFYLIAKDKKQLEAAIQRAAKIGYEKLTACGAIADNDMPKKAYKVSADELEAHSANYTIVDVRNTPEFRGGKFFENAMNIPLHELRERAKEVPTDKPIVVHCAAGFRSAVGSSILQGKLKNASVYDLSDGIKEFNADKPVTA